MNEEQEEIHKVRFDPQHEVNPREHSKNKL